MDYLQNALEITNKLGVEMNCEFIKHDFHFQGDEHKRDIYKITLKRGGRQFSFNFGQSLNNSQYYQDTKFKDRTYYLDGGCRTGKYKITHIDSYIKGFGTFDKPLTLIIGTEPNMYDVMTCLQKYDVGSFDDFCDEFGYDNDSIGALKIYKSVKEEYTNMCMLFTETELELLSEIQ